MFAVGDLVRCTGGYPKAQRIGVVRRVMKQDSIRYCVFFFDPPDKHWNNGVWLSHAMELICEGR